MGSSKNIIFLPSLITLFFLVFHCCTAINTTLSPTQYITDPQTVVSSAESFTLGFFSPVNSTNRYVGIWFSKIPGPTIVWVGNKENPLKDSSGVLRIADDGNIVVLSGRGNILWTSNVSNIPVNNSMVELLDSGNLVLREMTSNSNGRILWQSFDHPSNTILRGMKFGVNLKTGKKQVITSWKDTKSDPSTGRFTLELDPINVPQVIIVNNSNNQRYWRSGPWNNKIFIGIPNMNSVYINGFNLLRDDQEETVYLTLAYSHDSVLGRVVLDSNGKIAVIGWDEKNKEWFEGWNSLSTECDIYGKCGPFGSCNIMESPICSCLRGFEPKFKDEWRKENWSGGCVRRTELQCEGINRTKETKNDTSTNVEGKEDDGFLKLENMKVPDYVNWWQARVVEECEPKCLNNCSCIAYSFDSNIGCMWWAGNLIDIQKYSTGGVNLHIRVAYSDIGKTWFSLFFGFVFGKGHLRTALKGTPFLHFQSNR